VTGSWFLTDSATATLAQIYHYTLMKWGEDQADRYTKGIFDKFEAISRREVVWRPIAPEFGVEGFFTRHERHFIFWRRFSDGQLGFAAILHDGMLQSERLMTAFGELPSH
jgi:toxin ParE1/3/4